MKNFRELTEATGTVVFTFVKTVSKFTKQYDRCVIWCITQDV